MEFSKCFLAVGLLPILLELGCAASPQKTSEPIKQNLTEAETSDSLHVTSAVANEAQAYNFVEIKFNQGKSDLSASAKTSLDSVVEQARKNGKISEVMVLSWADQEYPSKSQHKLSVQQRSLAEKRNESVERYVKSLRSVEIDKYNMAEQPNAFERWFNTTDNKLKNSLVAAGLPTTAASVQYPSKALHSIILVKVE